MPPWHLQLPKCGMKWKLALRQIMTIGHMTTLLIWISQTRKQFMVMFAKLKNDVSNKRHLQRNLVCESVKSTVSQFTCSLADAKILVFRLIAFQSESLINRLICQIGVTLILKYFWWIFVPREKESRNTTTPFFHIWSKLFILAKKRIKKYNNTILSYLIKLN